MPLVPGQTAEVQRVVTPDLTADVLGNAGVTVFATRRRCLFDVEAWDEVEKIAEGRHERYVVSNLARFLERTTAKGRGPARAS